MRTGLLVLLAASPGLLALGAVAWSPGIPTLMMEYRAMAQAPQAAPLQLTPAAVTEGPALTLDQRMKLRCSAAFALIAERQAEDDAEALRYPPLAARGREFFVRSAGTVMYEGGFDRGAIDAMLTREAQELASGGTLAQVMPACLQALDASGL